MEKFPHLNRRSESSLDVQLNRFEKQERIDFVKNLFLKIDTEIIKDIFREILHKSGNDFSDVPNSIEFVCMNTAQRGNYHEGHITINAYHIPVNDRGLALSSLLSTYVHELAHFYSDGLPVDGVRHDGYQINGTQKVNTLLNEAVTELIADQVYRQYVQRSGDRGLFIDQEGRLRKNASYKNERKAAVKLIEELSEKIGIPSDTVFKALTQGYFSNETLAVSDALNEVLPPGIDFDEFVEQLKLEKDAALKLTTRVDL